MFRPLTRIPPMMATNVAVIAGTRGRVVVLVRSAEILVAAVDVLDDEIEPVEGVQLEIAEQLAEQGDVHVDAGAIIFEAKLERVVDLRLELEIAERRRPPLATELSGRQADRAVARNRIGTDRREFWQRAEDRNLDTARTYDALGLPEYYALEAFVKWKDQ